MEKPADTQHPIHDLLRRRWSPRAFADRPVEEHKIYSILEAARWAPSAYNEQPWHFIVGTAGDRETYTRLCECLVEANRAWASQAPLLLMTVASLTDEDGDRNRSARHDVGLAVASLTFQAMSLGLFVHQMSGFSRRSARRAFGMPEGYEPVTAIAVGYPGEPDTLEGDLRERETARRERKPLEAFVFGSAWGDSPTFLRDREQPAPTQTARTHFSSRRSPQFTLDAT